MRLKPFCLGFLLVRMRSEVERFWGLRGEWKGAGELGNNVGYLILSSCLLRVEVATHPRVTKRDSKSLLMGFFLINKI